jgi:hypothetical protein
MAFRLSEKGKNGEMARKGEAYWPKEKPTYSFYISFPSKHDVSTFLQRVWTYMLRGA